MIPPPSPTSRRAFLRRAALAASATAAGGLLAGCNSLPDDPYAKKKDLRKRPTYYKVSLAQWSLHRAYRAQELDPLDFPKTARIDYDIAAVELVNQFYQGRAQDRKYLGALRQRAGDHGVEMLLIMCDGEGALGDPDAKKRRQAVENHFKWLAAAQALGCHSIRVNAETGGVGGPQEAARRAADGLRQLSLVAKDYGQNVIVENHGGLSSIGEWLAAVIREVGLPNCGTLPDFGNFRIAEGQYYDRYLGVQELMPYAKAVSAKSHEFDDAGNEVHTDYRRMMRIVVDSGYRGWVGIEYEGDRHSEPEGILLTRRLLEAIHDEFTAPAA